jgi:type IV pilus assembly protein PilQ
MAAEELRMTNPRFMRMKFIAPYLAPIVLIATTGLTQVSCSTAGSDGDSEMAEDLDAAGGDSELAQELGTETSAPETLDSVGDSTADVAAEDLSLDGEVAATTDDAAGTSDADAALTQQLAQEDLTDTGGFDLDAAEAKAPAPQAAEPLVSNEPAIDMSPVAEPSASEVAAPIPMQASGDQVTITNLKYVSKKGGGTVLIETSAPATYHTREVSSQNQVVIEIDNAILPGKLKRPFNTKDFNQSIASMNAYQEPGSTTARVVIQFKTPQAASVQQTGNVLTVAANGAAGDEYVDASGNSAQASRAGSEDGDDGTDVASAGGDASDQRILPSSATDPTGFDNTRFYGKPISIEVRDTAVRDVINLIAEQSGANIVLAGEVDGNISLKLRQVPWDQALLIVMKTRGLGYVRQGSILRVAPYDNLQKEVDSARKVAEAQKAAEPLRVKVIPVGYAKVEGLDKQITPFLTKERGRVVSDVRTNSLIVTDTVDVLARITNLVKAIDTPPLQVLIEGKVVEAREVFQREIGINWGWEGQDTDIGGGRFIGNNFRVNPGLLSQGSGASGGMSLGTLDIFGDLTAQLRLYEMEDAVHVISSPRVVVLNNEAANIVQSSNIPIPTTTVTAGTPVTSTSYQAIEMKLDVTPQVTSESDIILNVAIKREFAGNVGSPPDINKREAKTKVLVRNGQTAVIGGVYQADTSESERGVPWLRKLPVLGWLFKQKQMNNNKSEMLVFITPRILNADTALQKENTL